MSGATIGNYFSPSTSLLRAPQTIKDEILKTTQFFKFNSWHSFYNKTLSERFI